MGYATVSHHVGYLTQGEFVITYQFLYPFNFLTDRILFDSDPFFGREQFAERVVVLAYSPGEEFGIVNILNLFRIDLLDNDIFYLSRYLPEWIIDKVKPESC